MAHVEIEPDGCIRVDLPLGDKLLAVHGSLRVPIVHVLDARVENEDGWHHFWRKLIGTNAPGLKIAGTFWLPGGLAFLDYGSGENCLVIKTTHERYNTIIVQPDRDQDAAAIAAEINRRARQPGNAKAGI